MKMGYEPPVSFIDGQKFSMQNRHGNLVKNGVKSQRGGLSASRPAMGNLKRPALG